jgi:hypothetical protein
MRDKKLKDILPELAQVMAKDFIDFSDEWKEVLKTYAEILSWLNHVLERDSPSGGLEAIAVQIIEDHIQKRSIGPQWNHFFPSYKCLAYELGNILLIAFEKAMEEWERDFDELMAERRTIISKEVGHE